MSFSGTEGCRNFPASVTCCVTDQDVSCSGPNGNGYCANDFACTGGSVPYAGYGCPGGSIVKCCVGSGPAPYCDNYQSPSQFGATGQCMRTSECTAIGGVSIPGLCSKYGSDMLCCEKDPNKLACAEGKGKCGNVNIPGQCQGDRYDNMCPGPSAIKCCAPKNLKYDCVYYKRSQTISCGSVTCQVQPSTNLLDGDYGIGEVMSGSGFKFHPLFPQKGGGVYWDYQTPVPGRFCERGFMILWGSSIPSNSDRHIVVYERSCFDKLTSIIELAQKTTIKAATCPRCNFARATGMCTKSTRTITRKRHFGITLKVSYAN